MAVNYILIHFWLSLCKIVRSSVILLLPLFKKWLPWIYFYILYTYPTRMIDLIRVRNPLPQYSMITLTKECTVRIVFKLPLSEQRLNCMTFHKTGGYYVLLCIFNANFIMWLLRKGD
jgi:hypothetical protein